MEGRGSAVVEGRGPAVVEGRGLAEGRGSSNLVIRRSELRNVRWKGNRDGLRSAGRRALSQGLTERHPVRNKRTNKARTDSVWNLIPGQSDDSLGGRGIAPDPYLPNTEMGLKPPWYPSRLSSRGVGSRRRRSATQRERERPLSPAPRGLSAIHKRASNEVSDVSPLSCSHLAAAGGRRPADRSL
ncbi:unnamed protein product [Boreogadus saida]